MHSNTIFEKAQKDNMKNVQLLPKSLVFFQKSMKINETNNFIGI